MGDPSSDVAGAANAAVFTMLGLVGGMLGVASQRLVTIFTGARFAPAFPRYR